MTALASLSGWPAFVLIAASVALLTAFLTIWFGGKPEPVNEGEEANQPRTCRCADDAAVCPEHGVSV